jgi:hypothetical protein
MSTDTECDAATSNHVKPSGEGDRLEDDIVSTQERLYTELQSIIQQQDYPTLNQPRSFLSDRISSWLATASTLAFHPITRCFTEWGGSVVKIALATLLEYEESRLSPEMIQLMRDFVVPAVFGTTTMDPLQQEVAHILVQCLIRSNTVPPTTSIRYPTDGGLRKRHRR